MPFFLGVAGSAASQYGADSEGQHAEFPQGKGMGDLYRRNYTQTQRKRKTHRLHPSPLSAHTGFFGGAYFSRANRFLELENQEPINWASVSDN